MKELDEVYNLKQERYVNDKMHAIANAVEDPEKRILWETVNELTGRNGRKRGLIRAKKPQLKVLFCMEMKARRLPQRLVIGWMEPKQGCLELSMVYPGKTKKQTKSCVAISRRSQTHCVLKDYVSYDTAEEGKIN